MTRRGVLAAALGGLMVCGVPGRATAFCRTTTIPVVADFQPTEAKCWQGGLPLFWRGACVGYDLQRAASRQVDLDAASIAISRAFSKWTGASCAKAGPVGTRVSIDVRDLGAVECGDVNYNPNGANQNVIVFRDDFWPHHDSNNALAITTVTFNSDTGEIYDADMEINTHDQHVTLSDPIPKDGYDFASIVTHETGHFLGLAHSGDMRATMFASYVPGTTALRSLTADDVKGICTVYPPDSTRAAADAGASGGAPANSQCDPTPRHGLTGECAAPEPTKSCSGSSRIAAAPPLAPGWVAAGLGLATLLGLRRSRRV